MAAKTKNVTDYRLLAEIFLDRKGQFRFRVKARNGEIICQSEAYTTKAKATQTLCRLFGVKRKDDLIDFQGVELKDLSKEQLAKKKAKK